MCEVFLLPVHRRIAHTGVTLITFQIFHRVLKISFGAKTGPVYHVTSVVMSNLIVLTTAMNKTVVSNLNTEHGGRQCEYDFSKHINQYFSHKTIMS